MKLTFTPFVGGASGKVGDGVASNWKGRAYVRQRVIPKNPKSAAQVVQRGLMARMAKGWRSLPDDLQALINTLGTERALSGFNLMTKLDLKAAADADPMRIVPGNVNVHGVAQLTDETTANDNALSVKALLGEADETHYAHLFTRISDAVNATALDPDIWTYHSGVVATVGALVASGQDTVVGQIAKDYDAVILVTPEATMALATLVSGGTALVVTSGETP